MIIFTCTILVRKIAHLSQFRREHSRRYDRITHTFSRRETTRPCAQRFKCEPESKGSSMAAILGEAARYARQETPEQIHRIKSYPNTPTPLAHEATGRR